LNTTLINTPAKPAIQQFAGNVAMAAAALELSPSTIYRKRQARAEMDAKRTA
jgi:two-component system repressor protein LuxO